ncbi:hypothetical protein PMIN04_000164 [Paraphaeosphaeria minitans]
MAFSVANLVKKAPAADAKLTSNNKLLNRYAEYDIEAQHQHQHQHQQQAKGERGIVVLSPNGDEPIFAPVEEYYTSDGAKNTKKVDGLAGTVSQYLAEQTAFAGLTAEARTVSFEVLFDAESPQEEHEAFLVMRSH